MGSENPQGYIVDVGSSWSAVRTIALRDKFNLPVVFIDPDSESLARVDARATDIKVAAAITTYDGEALFHYYQDGTHSLLETNTDRVHEFIDGHTGQAAKVEDWTAKRSEIVECLTLRTLISRLGITSIEFLKVDAQGHDLKVMESLGADISMVRHFEVEVQVTEFELYKGASQLSEVMDFACRNGFELIHSESQTHDQERILMFRNLQNIHQFTSVLSAEVLLKTLAESAPNAPKRSFAYYLSALLTKKFSHLKFGSSSNP
jgi:FkbM family methyltransferase